MRVPLGDPEAVRDLATRLRTAATVVSDAGNETYQMLTSIEFEAPRATRLISRARSRREHCRRHADELKDLAGKLDTHALWIEDTDREMRSIERRIRAWAAAHPDQEGAPVPNASIITGYPESGTLDWRRLGTHLRAAGVNW